MRRFRLKHMDLIPILIVAFLLFKLVFSTNMSIAATLDAIYSCVSYFIYGWVIAYFLNPLVSNIEKRVVKEGTCEKRRKTVRSLIIAAVFLLAIGVITVFFVSIIPKIVAAVTDFAENFPKYLANFQNWINSTFAFINPDVTEKLNVVLSQIAENVTNWATTKLDVEKVGGALGTAVTGSARFVINFVFGIVVSIYFLHGKESILNQLKRLTHAIFSEEKAENVIECGRKINKIFYDFILSKLVQAFVIFILGLLVLAPLGIKFAPVISLVLAVSNMIPYIGPWIGSVPCVALLLLYDPIQALILLAFILGMQIVDNVLIGPKITSDRVGISPLLVIAGVAVGGTFGGVIGMFVGVPVVAVIKLVFYDSFVERRLKEKKLDL